MRTGKLFWLMLVLFLALSISGCGKQPVSDYPTEKTESVGVSVSEQTEDSASGEQLASETKAVLQMRIGDTLVTVEWEDNESVQALRNLCTDTPFTIQMSMYGGFEQVGSIGESLPRNDVQTTTEAGDIVLYSGNQLVVFYGTNSWGYTRLGHITGQDAAGMAELLGNGDVTITLSME